MRRYAAKQVVGLVLVGLALFFAAGTWRWPEAWAFIGLLALIQVATGLLLARHSPELLIERSGVQAGTKVYDVPLAVVMAYSPLLIGIAAGLQRRAGMMPGVSWAWWGVGAVVAAGGSAWTLWAMLSNPFFAPVVRIQSERNHTVARCGPYRYVRHPGYLGAVLFALAIPALLGSTWALGVALVVIALAFLRTWLEDRVLAQQLAGYEAYCQQVRCRLIPRVW